MRIRRRLPTLLATVWLAACGPDSTGPNDDPAPAGCTSPVDVSIPVGGQQSLDADDCFFLPSGSNDWYRIAVMRPTLVADSLNTPSVSLVAQFQSTPVTASGPPPSGTSPTAEGPSRAALRASLARIDGTMHLEDARRREATRRFHAHVRELERSLPLSPETLLPGRPTRVAGAPPPLPATKRDMYLDPSRTCGSGTARPVILIDFDDNVAIYQDSVQYAAAAMSTAATGQILDYWASYGKGVVEDYFGPLPDLDGNGRLILVTSPDMTPGVAASVYSLDFLSSGTCASSNAGEVMYFQNDVIEELTAANPDYSALSVVAHEAKHVVSLYHSIARRAFHDLWIEEGTAEVAQIMSSRVAWAATGGPAVNARVTGQAIVSAASANGGRATPEMWATVSEVAGVIRWLTSQPNSILIDPVGATSGHSLYEASWHWHRFLGDAYGGAGGAALADSSFFRQLTDSTTAAGSAGVAQVTGSTFDELFDDLVLSMSYHSTPYEPGLSFSTWDFLTATAIFTSPPDLLPDGLYPWPVTAVGSTQYAPFATDTITTVMGPSGIRFHDFRSNGSGVGLLVEVTGAGASGRVMVTRLD